MSALYIMRFENPPIPVANGVGVLYIGQGVVLGVDGGNVRYSGTYTQREESLYLNGTMTAHDPVPLVTGNCLNAGDSIPVTAHLPIDFGGDTSYQLCVGGHDVYVKFEKIGGIP